MGIGTGIVLIVLGAILTFALNFETEWVNLDLIGWILMIAGAVVFLISLVLVVRKRSTVSTTREVGGGDERVIQRETRSDDVDPLA